MIETVFWAVATAAALIYWARAATAGYSCRRTLIKGLAVMPLALWALALDRSGMYPTALALALCSLGDMALSRPGQQAFLAGLIAFGLGHLAWIAAFIARFGADPALIAQPSHLWAALVLAGLAAGMSGLLLPRAGALRLPVLGYVCLIVAMGAAALATPAPMVMAGAALFVLSDALLGVQTFVLAPSSRWQRPSSLAIWPLYWLAVVALAAATGHAA